MKPKTLNISNIFPTKNFICARNTLNSGAIHLNLRGYSYKAASVPYMKKHSHAEFSARNVLAACIRSSCRSSLLLKNLRPDEGAVEALQQVWGLTQVNDVSRFPEWRRNGKRHLSVRLSSTLWKIEY